MNNKNDLPQVPKIMPDNSNVLFPSSTRNEKGKIFKCKGKNRKVNRIVESILDCCCLCCLCCFEIDQ